MKQIPAARQYYQDALKIYENPESRVQPNNIAVLYASLADFYSAQKDIPESMKYGKKALDLMDKFDQPEIRKNVYNILFKAYLETGQKDESKHYADLYTRLNDSLKNAERSGVNTSLDKIISESRKKSQQNISLIILSGSLLLIFLIVLTYLLLRRKEKKLHQHYENLISSLQKNTPPANEKNIGSGEDIKLNRNATTEKQIYIAPETVQALLSGLDKFEKSGRFTKKDVSLGYLVNYLGTNSKYLTEIPKQYKGKSFSQYINDLRIDHIIQLLYDDPSYRVYKISYLAEKSGFSTPGIFTKAFKRRTGILPSYFIENLSKES